MDGESGKLRE